ncbi:MAG TPA: AraC family transcriptional regulator [Spirochaetales bacterium]|nr:AraC family transcriptional regulator [Spirochaetales bacterium]HRY55233.1 AraC family transcriptional regulator [Spirochaetia bacterium]HRZ63964.1 AraC family transcriptional regulator [Spirochaetia bacterium]
MRLADIVFVYHLRDPRQIAWHGRDHSHPGEEWEFHYFVSGEGSFRNGGSRYSITSGSLYLSPPGMRHQIIASSDERPITYYATLVDAAGDEELSSLLASLSGKGARRELGSGYRFFFADLRQKHFSGDRDLELSARHALLAFLYELSAGVGPGWGAPDNVHVEKALALMEASLARDLDLDAICRRIGLSREHFVRLFAARMGMPPMRYFSRLKLEAAAAMLSSTGLSVGAISERLGYETQFSFSRAFKRQLGVAPSEYRARLVQKADFRLR